ncbi:replication/maintenance protein RepL [Spirosoma terrae]
MTVDHDGKVVNRSVTKHQYLVNAKEPYNMVYDDFWEMLNKLNPCPEIMVYGYLARQNGDGRTFAINKGLREEIADHFGISPKTVSNVIYELKSHKALLSSAKGTYIVNPRFTFRGSTSSRTARLKDVLERGYEGNKPVKEAEWI